MKGSGCGLLSRCCRNMFMEVQRKTTANRSLGRVSAAVRTRYLCVQVRGCVEMELNVYSEFNVALIGRRIRAITILEHIIF